ncbi:cell wall protein DAN4-like [Lathyrus oleraceus]|uniref:cell wall protein DAN4-like n=1 Tax=Pisum sativum TaxID=3888 RepID=UPI0021CE51F0|nr:cell wall protein DAN4-like [Pisum sativum]
MEDVTMNVGKPLNGRNLKSMGLIDKATCLITPSTTPTLSTTVTSSSTPPTINIHAPIEKSKSQQPTTSLPTSSEPTPSIPTLSKPNPSNQTFPSEPTTSDPIPLRTIISSPSLPLYNLQTTSLSNSEALLLNEPLLSSLSTTPRSPSYYDLTSNSEHSSSNYPDPPSPNLEDLQATTDSERTEFVPEPFEPIPEPSEAGLTLPIFDEALTKFSESSSSRFKKLSDKSSTSENPYEVRTNWNGFTRWMTSEIFKLKGLSKQVRNDFIRDAEERLRARMAKEEAEKDEREVAEKVVAEAAAREAAEEAAAQTAAREAIGKVAAKVDAREKAEQEAEAARATKVAHKAASEKTTEVALTQGESSAADFYPLVIKTREELQKEQQLVRTRLDKQDQVNTSIQSLLVELLHRMPPPPNP